MVPIPDSIFGREAELEALRQCLGDRRSFLLHGPAGVGKTLLLSMALRETTGVLYSRENGTAQALFRNLADALFAAGDRGLQKACPSLDSIERKSAVALKGIVREALKDSEYRIVLDHLICPSQPMAACVRDLRVSCNLPVIAVCRSDHMEDAGFVLPLYPDRKEKLALRNFDLEKASGFVRWCVERVGLVAGNLSDFRQKIVEHSQGNPGAILQMVHMAKQAKYYHEGQIKIAPLYIDYKIAMVRR